MFEGVRARFDEYFERRHPSTTPESVALPERISSAALAENRPAAAGLSAIGDAIPPGMMGGFDPAITLLNTRQTMNGYAHARPWAALPGRQLGEVDAATGMQAVTQVGDPDKLLDAALARRLHPGH